MSLHRSVLLAIIALVVVIVMWWLVPQSDRYTVIGYEDGGRWTILHRGSMEGHIATWEIVASCWCSQPGEAPPSYGDNACNIPVGRTLISGRNGVKIEEGPGSLIISENTPAGLWRQEFAVLEYEPKK